MTISELYQRLKEEGIGEDKYYLQGLYGSADDNEKIGLVLKKGRYAVEYETYCKERGEKHSIRIFTTENEACEYIYHKLLDEQTFSGIQKIAGLSGMTVNERLWVSGLMDEFDKARMSNNARAREILRWLRVDEASVEEILNGQLNTVTQRPVRKPVGKGTRLSNLIADTIIFHLIIMAHAFVFDWMGIDLPEEGSNWLGVYYFVLYFAYYFLFEYFFSKSPAKFATTTVVVAGNGGKPSMKDIFIRTLCRLIPFDSLSYVFGEKGWHDVLSHTMVVDDRRPASLLENQDTRLSAVDGCNREN